MAVESRDQIQLLYGRKIDLETINPILLSGECVCVLDSDTLKPIDFKFGNGTLTYMQLPSLADLVKDGFYTKEEGEEIFEDFSKKIDQALETLKTQGESLSKIQAVIDADATDDNRLTAVSTVKRLLDERFGRNITSSAGGASFPTLRDLSDGPYFYNGNKIEKEQLLSGDLAVVDGEEFGYKYNGSAWEPNSSKMLLTVDQEKALNSGVTSEDVTASREAVKTVAQHTATIQSLQDLLQATKASGATKFKAYKNQASVTVTGQKYPLGSECYVEVQGKKIKGFITSAVKATGVVSSIYLMSTDFDATTAEGVEVHSDYGVGCYCTIASTETEYDLSDVDSQLKQLVDLYADGKLTKGPIDGQLRLVRDGQLTPIFVSESTRYVDASYEGESTGLEFAPFKSGVEALNSIKSTVKPASIVYAPGEYDEVLDIRSGIAKNISGSAVSRQINTSVRQIQVSGVAERFGFRDIRITDRFSIDGASELYVDNIEVKGETSVAIQDEASFVHSVFEGTVIVSRGIVEFDACSFSGKSALEIKEGATVIIKNCTNVSPKVEAGATYVHISGNIAPVEGSESKNALVASDNATFVGLFDGIAFDKDYGYAPISIGAGVRYAIGSFLCDINKSRFPEPQYRRSFDGLSDKQIVTKARTNDVDGYEESSTYLDAHLEAISKRLKSLAESIVANAIDKIDLKAGKQNGSFYLVAYSGEQEAYHSEDFSVPGLGSAAFTDSTIYAKATDLQRYALSDTVTEQGQQLSSLKEAQKTDNENRQKEITQLQGDVAKKAEQTALEQTEQRLTQEIQSAVAGVSGRIVYPTAEGSSSGYSDDGSYTSYPKEKVVFKSLEAANTFVSAKYYYKGGVIPKESLQVNDKLFYWSDDSYSTQCQAVWNGESWAYFATMSVTFSTEQQAAIDSGITSKIVEKIGVTGSEGETLVETVNKKQSKLIADENGSIVTHSGTEGQEGAARKVVSQIGVLSYNETYTLGGDGYEGTSTDIPTAEAVYNLAKAFASYVEQLIGENNKKTLPQTDGVVERKEGSFVATGYQALAQAIKEFLGFDSYYDKTTADKKYLAVGELAGQEKKLLTPPAGESTTLQTISIKEETVAIGDTADNASIPTTGAVASALKNLDDKFPNKQDAIKKQAGDTVTVLTSPSADGKDPGTLPVVDAEDAGVEERKLPTQKYVDSADEKIEAKITELEGKVFAKADPTTHTNPEDHREDKIPVLKDADQRMLMDCGLTVSTILELAAKGNFKVVEVASVAAMENVTLTDESVFKMTGGYTSSAHTSNVTLSEDTTYHNLIVQATKYTAGTEFYYLKSKGATISATFVNSALGIDISSTATTKLKFIDSTINLFRNSDTEGQVADFYSTRARLELSGSNTISVTLSNSYLDVVAGALNVTSASGLSIVILHNGATITGDTKNVIVVYAEDYEVVKKIANTLALSLKDGKVIFSAPLVDVTINGNAATASIGDDGVTKVTLADIDDGDLA